jgi:hypothetical protein
MQAQNLPNFFHPFVFTLFEHVSIPSGIKERCSETVGANLPAVSSRLH